jgi:GT2 family glycosyltransferase
MTLPSVVFEQLRSKAYDLIIFQDHSAPGHGCITAKRCGLAFTDTALVVLPLEVTGRALARRGKFPGLREQALSWMERFAIEAADAWVAGPEPVVTWMQEADWKLPRRVEREKLCQLPDSLKSLKRAPVPAQTSITVVLTHYERPELIRHGLLALGLQSDPNFKVIVVDDGSTSRPAVAMLDRLEGGFAGLDVRVIRQPNRYLGAARNHALRHVTTPYVVLLDDDNVPFPTMIEVFGRAIVQSGADIITCQMQLLVDPVKRPSIQDLLTTERWGFSAGPAPLGVVRNCFGDATAIYRRELFDEIGGFHEKRGVGHEDWAFYLRASLAGRTILSLPQPLFWYRVAPNSMARSTDRYANMQAVADAMRPSLPPTLSGLPEFLIGLCPQR